MTTIDNITMSREVEQAASDLFAFHGERIVGGSDDADWASTIDTLLQWRLDRSGLADDDFEPPSIAVVEEALRLALRMKEYGLGAFDRVSPGGEEDLAFERSTSDARLVIQVLADETIEIMMFKGRRLESRETLNWI